MHVTAIVAAGGRGERFGAAQPKQMLVIGGRSILERSVQLLLDHPAVAEVIVALPPNLAGDLPESFQRAPKALRVVAGGPRRQDSVANAFAAVSDKTDVVLIHDAARPFASAGLVSRSRPEPRWRRCRRGTRSKGPRKVRLKPEEIRRKPDAT